MKTIFTKTALALAASGLAVSAVPAAAADFHAPGYHAAPSEDGWNRHRRDRDRYRDRYDRNDGRTYCRKKDGTTGLIIGGAAGALIGREVDGGRNRTLGTILGAAAGALIGKEIDGGTRCR